MSHHRHEEEHQASQSGPVIHGGEGDPLGEGVDEATPDDSPQDETNDQPPLPDDEPKPGL